MKLYPNGLGESAGGDVLATQKPLFMSGNVWWVNSATGVDAGGSAGQDREKPLATIGQANTNATDGDIIVLQSGHNETLSAQLNLKAVSLVGIGTTSGKPAAQLKINSASATLLNLAVAATEIRNVYFPASVQSNTSANGKLRLANIDNCVISGCYFESSALDQLAALEVATIADEALIENCTFVSTATTVTTRPTRGLYVSGAITDLHVVGCVFDDGTVGYSTAACDISGGTITRLKGTGISLLRGAEVLIASATTGYFIPSTSTGGGKVTW